MKILLIALCLFAVVLIALSEKSSTVEEEEFNSIATAEAYEALEESEDMMKKKKKKKKNNSGGGKNNSGGGKNNSGGGKKKKGNTCGVGLIGSCVRAAKKVCGKRKCCSKIRFGVDTNDANMVNDPNRLWRAGVHFVVRYISNQATLAITLAETQRWKKAKMPLVAVWEMGRLRPVEGGSVKKNFANGVTDGRNARRHMAYIGAPSSAPIYFAVDTFINPKNPEKLPAGTVIKSFNAILPYFRGIRKVLAFNRIGAYGPYTAIKGLFDKKIIKYGWLASSFDTNGRWDSRIHLYQCSTLPPDVFGSTQLDYTFAIKPNYGQFKSKK
jgi:hypothetical protein